MFTLCVVLFVSEQRSRAPIIASVVLYTMADRSDYLPSAQLKQLARGVDPKLRLEPEAEQVQACNLSKHAHTYVDYAESVLLLLTFRSTPAVVVISAGAPGCGRRLR